MSTTRVTCITEGLSLMNILDTNEKEEKEHALTVPTTMSPLDITACLTGKWMNVSTMVPLL
uniref:Uncharacterized protein n=1 Tax=Moniliophthora roreri TaxID=221103 RepID=A0A0W0F7M6_MONRR